MQTSCADERLHVNSGEAGRRAESCETVGGLKQQNNDDITTQ